MYFAISATVDTFTREPNYWVGAKQVPTFYLDGSVQGITSEAHAETIAQNIVDPLGQHTVHVSAVCISHLPGQCPRQSLQQPPPPVTDVDDQTGLARI
jgi:hypothetical protein